MSNTEAQAATNSDTSGPQGMSDWLGEAGSDRVAIGHGFRSTSERALGAHEHLFLEGDSQSHIYQVLNGVVGEYKLLADGRRQIITFYYPGDMIGLNPGVSFNSYAEALCESRVRCVPIDAVNTLITSEPGFGRAMLKVLSTELAETRDQVLSLGRKSAMEKLATFLLRISHRNEREGIDDALLHLPMTRAEIADYLGLTVETVSRNFTKLKLSQVIQLISNSEVQIIDRDLLKETAQGNI